MIRSQTFFTPSGARNPNSVCAPSRDLRFSSFIRMREVCARQRATTLLVGFLAFLLSSLAAAETLTGTVKNSTTGKPAAGDEVVLLSLRQGMEEAGRTKTDAGGNFSFKLDNQGPHLIRAVHDGVTYHRMAPPGTTSVAVEVYEVSTKVDAIEIFTDIMYLRPVKGELVVSREFGVQNSSNPPRTQMNQRDLEFYLPNGAHVVNASAMTENGLPLRSAPVREGGKNRYAFQFPLRPGLTRFEVTYLFPYKGITSIDPESAYPVKHFVVVFPKTMQFKAAPSSNFQSIQLPNQPESNVQMASDTPVGRSLAFSISGEGKLETDDQNATQAQGASEQNSAGIARSAQPSGLPGGGLGLPTDAPDPLQGYRWWILGGFSAVFLIGGIYVARRRRDASFSKQEFKSRAARE